MLSNHDVTNVDNDVIDVHCCNLVKHELLILLLLSY